MSYTNYAFISYKREDERWAKWLQRKLEAYRLPSVIRKEQPGAPVHLRPIFRDRTDLSGGVLADRLRQELMQSRFLIVICSPGATRSSWVNKEARTFIDAGRLEQVIPFIVEGEPHAADASRECLPQALLEIPRERELLAINVQEVGRTQAFVRLVATMLGVRFDTLWGRHRRQQARRRWMAGAAAVMCALAALFVWDYNRATYSFFADYVDANGVPEGIVPLTLEQVGRRSSSVECQYRRIPFGQKGAYGWRLARVRLINSARQTVDYDNSEYRDRYPQLLLEYDAETGAVTYLSLCDRLGRVKLRHALYEHSGQPACVADLRNALQQLDKAYVGSALASMAMGETDMQNRRSKIVRYVYERDAAGHIIRQTYHSNNDDDLSRSATYDADGIFGRRFTLDSLGRRTAIDYIGRDGEPVATKIGIAGRRYEYDQSGAMSRCTYVGLDGKPILNEELWAICIIEHDANGNPVQEDYLNADGQPVINTDGFSRVTYEFGADGLPCRVAYFGTDGQPIVSTVSGSAECTAKFNRHGYMAETAAFDARHQPMMGREGFCISRRKYDRNNNVTELTWFDTDGKPSVNTAARAARVTRKYDSHGNQLEEAFFDTGNQPCIGPSGYARSVQHFDRSDRLVRQDYYGTDGRPCMCTSGYASIAYRHDQRGNIEEMVAYGTDGRPCYAKEGAAIVRKKYDDAGNETETAFFDVNSEPMVNIYGVHRATMRYDSNGCRVEACFFDTGGRPTLNWQGLARQTWDFDERGNNVRRDAYGVNGERVMTQLGFSSCEFTFDEMGRNIESRYFDEKGRPCRDAQGVVTMRAAFTPQGQATDNFFFDEDGKPCLGAMGAWHVVQKYDERGQAIEHLYYGTDGQPCRNSEGIFRWTEVHDERGLTVEARCYGPDGQPCLNTEGAAHMEMDYDERCNRTEVRCYGTDGQPTLNNRGYARHSFRYDERGRCVREDCSDAEGQPCLSTLNGAATVLTEYDEQDQPVRFTYLGTDGRPTYCTEGYATLKVKYDAFGRKVEQAAFAPDGSPCPSRYGNHRVADKWNDRGQLLERAFYGSKGEPVEAYGFHREKLQYDDHGRLKEIQYFSAQGIQIANQVETAIVAHVIGQAAQQGMPEMSIILRWNGWTVGDGGEALTAEIDKSRYAAKDIDLLTPDKAILHLRFEKGLAGFSCQQYAMDKAEAAQWRKQLPAAGRK